MDQSSSDHSTIDRLYPLSCANKAMQKKQMQSTHDSIAGIKKELSHISETALLSLFSSIYDKTVNTALISMRNFMSFI